MSISDLKREARRDVHEAFGEPCSLLLPGDLEPYPTAEQIAAGLQLTVRFGTRARMFSPENDGLTIMENVERVIFNTDQLDALELEPTHGAVVDMPGMGLSLTLDQPLDPDGPLNAYWLVVRS